MSAGSAVATVEWFPDNSNIGGDAGPYSICNYPNHGDRDEFPNFGWGTGQLEEDLDTELTGVDAVTETIQESAWDCVWFPESPSIADVDFTAALAGTEVSGDSETQVPIGHELALAKLDIQKLSSYSAVVKVEWDFDSDGLYEEVDNGPFRVRSGRYASHRFTSIGTTHSWESAGEKAVGLRVTYENSSTEVVTGIVRVASREVAGYAETLMLTDGNLRPGVLTEIYLRAGSLSANEPVSIWLYPDFADATDTASPVELVSGVAYQDGSLSLEFAAPESLEEGDTKTLVVTTSLGNVGFRETVSVAAPVAAPASDGWDYVYGNPGPLDYSEFLEAYPTSDGGLFLVGQWAGDFEGLSAGARYRPFVQFRNSDGAVQWTKSPAIGASVTGFEVFGGVDGNNVLYVVVKETGTGSAMEGLVITYTEGGAVHSSEVGSIFGGLGVTGQDADRFVVSPVEGVLAIDNATQSSPLIRRFDAALIETGSLTIPSEFTQDSSSPPRQPKVIGAAVSDGSFWVLGEIPKPLPHLEHALGFVHVNVSESGVISRETTVKHYGYGCFKGNWSVPRVTTESIWVYGCGGGSGLWAFSSTDGSVLGEVTGLASSSESGFSDNASSTDEPYIEVCADSEWSCVDIGMSAGAIGYGQVTFSSDGALAFASVESGSIWTYISTSHEQKYAVWQVDVSGAASTWTLISEESIGSGVEIEVAAPTSDEEFVVAGSTTVDLSVKERSIRIQSSSRRAFIDQRSLMTESTDTDAGGTSSGGSFSSLSKPERLLDTRGSGVKVGEIDGSGSAYVLQVGGNKGVPESGVAAVALNVTVVDGEAGDYGGFVTVYPCGARPDASNLNFTSGQTIPNSVIAPVSADGEVCFYVYGKAHLLADVSGYFN